MIQQIVLFQKVLNNRLILFNNCSTNCTFEKVLIDQLNTFCVKNRTFELSVYKVSRILEFLVEKIKKAYIFEDLKNVYS